MEPSDIVLLALGVICPPGSVALKRGLSRDFIISVGLTLLFWIPGIAYSWYLVFKYPSENFWRRRMSEQYVSIEEGLRRNSINSTALSDDENVSRSNTMTSESAMQHHRPRSSRHNQGRKPRRSRKSSASSRKRSTSVLQDAARSYALRQQQQRHEVNSIKQWFVDRFYFPDPTQVPPASESNSNELRSFEPSSH